MTTHLPCFLANCFADYPAKWIELLKMHIDQQWSMPQNSQKTSESYKTRENASHKTRERLCFRAIFRKLENEQKTLGK